MRVTVGPLVGSWPPTPGRHRPAPPNRIRCPHHGSGEPGTQVVGVNPRAIAVGRLPVRTRQLTRYAARSTPDGAPRTGRKGYSLRTARTLVRALLIGIVSVGIAVPATVASAAPSPGDLQRQIDDASNNLEKIVEQYNHVTEDLKATTAAQAALATQLAPLQASMDAAYSAVQDIAVKRSEEHTSELQSQSNLVCRLL